MPSPVSTLEYNSPFDISFGSMLAYVRVDLTLLLHTLIQLYFYSLSIYWVVNYISVKFAGHISKPP